MGVTSLVAGNSMDRSTAWVMTKFDKPSKSQSDWRYGTGGKFVLVRELYVYKAMGGPGVHECTNFF